MESPGPLDEKNAGISGCSYLWELRGFHPIHENLEYSSKFHGAAMFYGDLFDGNIIYIYVSTYLILYIYIHPTI